MNISQFWCNLGYFFTLYTFGLKINKVTSMIPRMLLVIKKTLPLQIHEWWPRQMSQDLKVEWIWWMVICLGQILSKSGRRGTVEKLIQTWLQWKPIGEQIFCFLDFHLVSLFLILYSSSNFPYALWYSY